MSVLKGDFIGFSYGINPKTGKPMHSSDLGIVRTSNGSRFDENLLPTMQDKTVQVPGGDGTYYFGSYYTQRQFSVPFAFDSLTEEQIVQLKSHFGDKKIHDLIFDERPYKTYRAKVTGSATMKHIPFAEGETNRLYKGEGTIQFTCYDPFARCDKKWWSQYNDTNKNEWFAASGLKVSQGNYDKLNGCEILLYNPGDIESHFLLRMNFSNKQIPAGRIDLNGNILEWNKIEVKGSDAYIKINTKLNLIEGYNSSGNKTGNIYNQYIKDGTFFKIPLGESKLTIDQSAIDAVPDVPIEYSYYYL